MQDLNQKTQNAKEVLARSSIRTMKKDLKRLREGDIVKESQKILAMAAPKNTEEQKQRAFLLQKQETDLRYQAETTAGEKLRLAKEQVLIEKEKQKLESRLTTLSQREPVNEKLKNLEEAERSREYQEVALKAKITQTQQELIQAQRPVQPRAVALAPKPITENQQRKKFLEDVEAWANSNK